MKRFLVLCGLFFSAWALPYTLKGGYKPKAKYVYHYEGKIRPSQVPLLKEQFTELHLNATVELQPISSEKFILKISKHSFNAIVSDPKYTDGPIVYERHGELKTLSDHIKKPIKFTYRNGLVQQVFAHKTDAEFSVNLKKGIINLFHVDIKGKDKETSRDDLFTKNEASVVGICSTSYSILDFNVTDAKNKWKTIGYNITKVIDMNNCTMTDYEVYNKVIPGPNENQVNNPLKSSATIRYNILGTKSNFKIEEVHAVGTYVLYLVAENEGGIVSVTDQRLTLIRVDSKIFPQSQISKIEQSSKSQKLVMNVRSFGHLEHVPEFSESSKSNIVNFVYSTLRKMLKLLPEPDTDSQNKTSKVLPQVSSRMLEVVHVIRNADKSVHAKIWDKCSKDKRLMKWTLYAFSLCNTQECMKFLKDKLNSLPDELISDYLLSLGFNGKPTKQMVNYLKQIVNLEKIKRSPYLTKLAYLSATSMIKTFCKQTRPKSVWMDEVLVTALKKIPTQCSTQRDTCKPISHLPAVVVLALAENIERPVLFSHLERIVFTESLPSEIRVKALLAIRPLVKPIPRKVHISMIRIFRDLRYDTELRTIAFTIMMDNPTYHDILQIARILHREPSISVRRFVYDKFIAMRQNPSLHQPYVYNAVKLALEVYSKSMIPSQILSASNCFHLNWFSKNWTIGASLRHEEIYKTNFLPNLLTSKLNVSIFGRNISVIEAQLRFQGLQEYLNKLFGPNGYSEQKHSIFDFIRSRRSVESVSKTIDDLKKKLPTFTVPDEKLKIFTQLKMFDKIFHINETTIDKNMDLKSLFLSGSILRARSLEAKLKKGIEYKFSKPFMPVEVIYRMPSLIGVPMTTNLTSLVLPVSIVKFKLEVKPGLFTPSSLLWKKRDSAEVEVKHKLTAITDIRGKISFRLPSIEVGGFVKTVMNVSTSLKVEVDYNFKTRELKTEIKTPKHVKEILTVRKKAYHFLKCDQADKTSNHDGKTIVNKLSNGGVRWSEWTSMVNRKGPDNRGENDDETFGGYPWYRKNEDEGQKYREKYEHRGDWYAGRWMTGGKEDVTPHRFRRSLDKKNNKNGKLSVVARETTSYSKVSTSPVTSTPSLLQTKDQNSDSTSTSTTSTTSTTSSTVSTVSPSLTTSTATSTASVTPTFGGTATETTTSVTKTPGITEFHKSDSTTSSTSSQTKTFSIHSQTSSSTSYSMSSSSVVHPETKEPHGPDSTGHSSTSFHSKPSKMIKIPIEIDQLGKIELFGMERRPDIHEEWALKIQGKFVNVRNGKVSISNTPMVFNVTFKGKNRRIASFKAPDQSFITVSPDSPCLKTTKQETDPKNLFVLSMVANNITTIRSVVSAKKSKVPSSWGIAKNSELEELEEVQRIFQKEMVDMDDDESILEEKVYPSHQKVRLTHWTIKGNSVCLTPYKRSSVLVKIKKRTSLRKVLRRQSYKQGICIGHAFNLKTCLHGFRPYPRLTHLPWMFSPFEYRFLLKPISKKPDEIEIKIKLPKTDTKSPTYDAEIKMDGTKPDKKIKVKVSFDYSKKTAMLTVEPSNKNMLKFSKFCMKLKLHSDNVSLTASFDPSCSHKNIKVDLLASKTLPRYWLAFRIKHDSKNVPRYILDSLDYLKEKLLLPALLSTAYVYPRPNPGKKYQHMSKLSLYLPTNKTLKLVLKTRNLTYMVDDIKLPKILDTLPKGSTVLPFLSKLPYSLMKPHCLHFNNSFVTFDKKPYNFTLRGNCEHNLLRICDKNSTNIAVVMRRVDHGMKRALTIYVDKTKIEIKPGKSMHRKPQIKLNSSPYTFGKHREIKDKSNQKVMTFTWEPETKTISVMHHKYKLYVKLRESHIVSLSLSSFFSNKTCGLCGNYDGEKYNDFITPEGSLVNDVRRPTIFYSKVKKSAETIFASSWITPTKKCTKDCHFHRVFVKLTPKKFPGKVCLTNFKISQCLPACKTSNNSGMTRIPSTCVPKSQLGKLKKYLINGKKINFSQAEEFLADVSIPEKCNCKC